MPFAVVETVNARGHKELSVVPDKWLRSSKNGSVVLWPNVKSVTEQEKLLRDEYSSPNKSWLIYKCSVKRNPISSLPEAKRMMEDLSGESSSDAAQLIRRKRKLVNPNTGNFQKMLILDSAPFTTPVEKTTHSPETIVVEVPGTVQHEMLPQTPATPILPASSRTVVTKPKHTTPVATEKNKETDIHTPQAAPKTIFNATAASTEKNSQTVHYETIPPGVSPSAVVTAISADNSSTVQYVAYETVHESNLPKNSGNATTDMQFVINTTSAIFDQQHQTNTRLDRLEKRVADIVIQNEFIVDAIRKLSSQKTLNEEAPSIWFDPIQNAEQLADLDLKLANNDFKSNMVNMIKLFHALNSLDNFDFRSNGCERMLQVTVQIIAC